MKKLLKDRYLWGIIALFLIMFLYLYFQHYVKTGWLPSETTMPVTDTAIDLSLFFTTVALGAYRFKVKGGIITAIALFPILVWGHRDALAEADIEVELLFSEVSGIIIAIILGSYVASKDKLQKALEEVKTLSGFIPICASCKKIRDDSGYWRAVEQYIEEHSSAEFTHHICPDCVAKLYPDLAQQIGKKQAPES